MADTTYTTLKKKILAKLQTIAQLAEVSDNPELNFQSYPAAIIIPADGESDWETNAEDQRMYAFDVIVYEETKGTGISQALDNLLDAVDYVLDSFASDKQLSGITMPTNKILITVDPVTAGWGDIPDKELLAATVKLRCHVSVSN